VALEHRSNGRVYYYRSRRIGKTVRREYLGAGYTVTLMAKLDGLRRHRKDFAAWERKERLDKWRRRFTRLREAIARANCVVADALRAAGWHQHKREWRKRRGATMATDLAAVIGTWTPGELDKQAGALTADVSDLAARGDRSVLPVVRQYLDNPAAVALWGDLGRSTFTRWVKLHARNDLLVEEAMLRRAQALREGLAGPNPTALDALLAERVILAWVSLTVLEEWQSKIVEGFIKKGASNPDALLGFFPKHIDHAHRQLMAACRTLAKVRRAKLPDVLALVKIAAAPPPSPAVPVEAIPSQPRA
jgi:hypothetical protein